MKRTLVLALLLLQALAAYSQDDAEESGDDKPALTHFQLYAGLSYGGLVGGDQYALLNEGLSPRPDTVDYLAPTVGLRVYPSRSFGVEVGSDPVSLVYAVKNTTGSTTTNTTRPLLCYNYNNFFGGIAFRYLFEDLSPYRLTLNASLGANYNVFVYNRDLTSLLPSNYNLYAVSPAVGWYGAVGAEIAASRGFFVGGRVAYFHLHNRIEQTGHDLDGELIKLTGYAGVAF